MWANHIILSVIFGMLILRRSRQAWKIARVQWKWEVISWIYARYSASVFLGIWCRRQRKRLFNNPVLFRSNPSVSGLIEKIRPQYWGIEHKKSINQFHFNRFVNIRLGYNPYYRPCWAFYRFLFTLTSSVTEVMHVMFIKAKRDVP